MAFAEVGTHYGNVILVNEGFKAYTKNINGNSCPRFPKRPEDFSPPLIKQLLKNCRPCSVQNQENTQQMLFRPKARSSWLFLASPSCVGGVHTAFRKGCSKAEWVLEEVCVRRDDALQP